jgi:DNA-binding transcriptional LysR family regulator
VANGRHSKLHVGYAASLTTKLLPQAFRLLQTEFGELQILLHDLSTEEKLRGLHENKLDVALLRRPPDKLLKGLIFEEFCRKAVCVALNRTHRLASARQVDLRTLAEERLIGYSREEFPEYPECSRQFSSPSSLKGADSARSPAPRQRVSPVWWDN